MTTTERSTTDDDASPERTESAPSSSLPTVLLGVVVVALLGPVYLLVVAVYNGGRLAVHVFEVGRNRARLWARIVGTATVQRRLEGDILAASADVRRFARELYQLRDGEERPLTEADIDHLDTLIDYRGRATAEPFRVRFPFGESLKRLATGNAESPLHGARALFSEQKSAEPPEIPANAMWARTAMEMLNQADELLKSNTEAAYRAFLRADRYLVLGEFLLFVEEKEKRPEKALTDPLQSHARLVWNAVSDYEGRRVTVVRELLFGDAEGDDPDPKPDLSIIELDKAMYLLNTYRLEDYRRFETLRVNILTFVGIASLLVVGALVFFPTMEAIGPVGIPERRLFQLVLAFGALGAAISGVRTIEHDSESLRSLEQILGYWLSVVRMFVGALSAFIVAIFLFSGVLAPEFLSLPLVLGVSLAAGFSERLLLRAISSFENRAGGPVPERRGRRDG